MLPDLIPITEVKRNAAQVLDQLREQRRPVLITEHGRSAAILLDVQTYEELLRRADFLDRLSQGKLDFQKAMEAAWGPMMQALKNLQVQVTVAPKTPPNGQGSTPKTHESLSLPTEP